MATRVCFFPVLNILPGADAPVSATFNPAKPTYSFGARLETTKSFEPGLATLVNRSMACSGRWSLRPAFFRRVARYCSSRSRTGAHVARK